MKYVVLLTAYFEPTYVSVNVENISCNCDLGSWGSHGNHQSEERASYLTTLYFCTQGCAFLYVAKERQAIVHPLVLSWGDQFGMSAEFGWIGTYVSTRGGVQHSLKSIIEYA